jgi:hypothetical protein
MLRLSNINSIHSFNEYIIFQNMKYAHKGRQSNLQWNKLIHCKELKYRMGGHFMHLTHKFLMRLLMHCTATTSITMKVVLGVQKKHLTQRACLSIHQLVCDLVSWPEPLDKFSSNSAWMTFISCWTILISSHTDT